MLGHIVTVEQHASHVLSSRLGLAPRSCVSHHLRLGLLKPQQPAAPQLALSLSSMVCQETMGRSGQFLALASAQVLVEASAQLSHGSWHEGFRPQPRILTRHKKALQADLVQGPGHRPLAAGEMCRERAKRGKQHAARFVRHLRSRFCGGAWLELSRSQHVPTLLTRSVLSG